MCNKKILVVDDEEHILELVSFHLKKEGYETVRAESGQEAIDNMNKEKYDLVILDWMLPNMDGIDILKWIRNKSNQISVPVIFLTAKSDEFDTVLALEMGADDFISKPFRNKEFTARVKAVMRRAESKGNKSEEKTEKEWNRNNFYINELNRTVNYKNEEIELSRKEYELFILLIKHPGRVFTREELLNNVWDYSYMGSTRTVDVHIRQIRKKLQAYDKGNYVLTVHGVGYKWSETGD